MKPRVEPMVLEIEGLCTALSIGKNSAYELLNNGEIDCFKIGSCWKIPVSSVEEYIRNRCEEHKQKVMCTIDETKQSKLW